MLKTILVKQYLEDGSRVLEQLRHDRFPVTAAFWYYIPAPQEQWMLFIASPLVDRIGPLGAYGRLQRALAKIAPQPSLSLSNISLISPEGDEYESLKSAVAGTGRFGHGPAVEPLQDVIFEDAYVYEV